jgi:hypothetical protein
MGALGWDALAARFTRAGEEPPAPTSASPQASEPRPWLTAEAYLPPVTGPGPSVGSDTPGGGGPPPSGTPRRPKRRHRSEPSPPELFMCPFCRTRHQPTRMHSGGLSDAYSRIVDPSADPYSSRPMPLNKAGLVHDAGLIRDSFNPWRGSSVEPPPTPTPSIRERLAAWWEQRD